MPRNACINLQEDICEEIMQKLYLVLSGGLGNQMFQYAAARSYQLKQKSELILCDFHFETNYNGIRNYSLAHCNLPQQIALATEDESSEIKKIFIKRRHSIVAKIMRRLPDCIELYYAKLRAKHGWISPVFAAQKFITFSSFHPNVNVMHGGFQSPKYFNQYQDKIRQELRMKCVPPPKNAAIMQTILQTEAVAVHIRRGDYLIDRFKNLNVCTEQYFINAMDYLLTRLQNPVFYVFSNTSEDLQWIAENLDLPGNIIYVNQNNHDYEELQLMYSCKHFVISNSTFSWWGQFLSDCPDKIVCAPSEWNRQTGMKHNDIYQDGWKIIEANKNTCPK